jgi:hypothetical protein
VSYVFLLVAAGESAVGASVEGPLHLRLRGPMVGNPRVLLIDAGRWTCRRLACVLQRLEGRVVSARPICRGTPCGSLAAPVGLEAGEPS